MIGFVAMGSNMGDRLAHLWIGMQQLDQVKGLQLIAQSPIYETPPMYELEQPPFLNLVVSLEVNLDPRTLLHVLKEIESAGGRDHSARRNGPRPLDLDILALGDLQWEGPDLVIPHPRLAERKFVLQPWNDIAPEYIIAGHNRSVQSLLAECMDSSIIQEQTNIDYSKIA